MPAPARWTLLAALAVAASIGGHLVAKRWGVDPARIPQPPFDQGEVVAVQSPPQNPALASSDPSTLRDARFARHNGIDISSRIASGNVFLPPAGTTATVDTVDMDLARVRLATNPGKSVWMATENLVATENRDAQSPGGKPEAH